MSAMDIVRNDILVIRDNVWFKLAILHLQNYDHSDNQKITKIG